MEENKGKGKPYNPKETEDKWYRAWLEAGYFKGNPNSSKEPFTIVIPPPNVTDVLHLGHALNNTIQDILIRQKRMSGYETEWLPGADHAGIATQIIIEKQLAKEGTTRRELGHDKFLERVQDWAYRNKDLILNQLQKIGSSCDWERTRFTLDAQLSQAVTEVFLRLYKKGLIYRGHRIVNWCPVDQTSISDDEVEHREIDSHLWHIRYKLKGSDEYLTVATTRPETMLGDTALAVNPTDTRYKKYVGKTVILPILEREIPIVADSYVDPQFGTGVVKVTPAHDPNDFEIGRRHDLPQINILNLDGTLNENAGKYKGLDRFDGRKQLLKDLEAKSFLVKTEKYKLIVGLHDRCGYTVIEPMLSEQWFVKMEPLAQPAIEALKSGRLQFHPEHWSKTYLHWMENIRDWCISRQLWWGHRIPIYYCQDCGEIMAAAAMPDKCSRCESTNLLQDEDVLDTWFSSWLWPFSVFGWPEDTDLLKKFYPTDVLVTASEIIFLWVARMVMAGYEFMGEPPFSDIYIHGTVRDANGIKMSKSLGNGIDPLLIIGQHGADSLRISLILATPDGQDPWIAQNSFELGRNFNNKIWNASRFVMMNLGDEKIDLDRIPKDNLTLIDHWVLSRLEKTIKTVDGAIDDFRLNAAAKALYDFVWKDFCDWYIELAKPRFASSSAEQKQLVRQVTGYVFKRILLLLHPFTPFITEEIYQQFAGDGQKTIMFGPWPKTEEGFENDELESKLARLQSVVNAIRNIRSEMNVPPGKRANVFIRVEDKELKLILSEYVDFYKDLAKIDKLTIGSDVKKPPMSASAVLPGAEVFIPLEGLIDIEFERSRLSKELANLKLQLEKLSKKLGNSDYLANAPKDVVNRDRSKRTEFEQRVEKINTNLEQLLNW